MAAKINVVFYSMYGHVYQMAQAVADGAREAAEVSLWQVPELVSDEILEKSGAATARAAFAHVPVAKPTQLAEADAIIFGTPTRFGNMCPDAKLPRSNGQVVGEWCDDRESGERPSPVPHRSTAVRKPRSSVSTPPCCIMG